MSLCVFFHVNDFQNTLPRNTDRFRVLTHDAKSLKSVNDRIIVMRRLKLIKKNPTFSRNLLYNS